MVKELKKGQLPTVEYLGNDVVHNPVAVDDKEGRLINRSRIEGFQALMQSAFESQGGDRDAINDDGLEEYFIDSAYVRGLTIPKDTTIVSELWSKERLWIIASGEVTITSELGTVRVKAPYTVLAPSGSKVAIYTHEDTLWYAIAGATADKDTIKDKVIAKDYSECSYPWDKLEEKTL